MKSTVDKHSLLFIRKLFLPNKAITVDRLLIYPCQRLTFIFGCLNLLTTGQNKLERSSLESSTAKSNVCKLGGRLPEWSSLPCPNLWIGFRLTSPNKLDCSEKKLDLDKRSNLLFDGSNDEQNYYKIAT
jgi:hypothetical protein